MKKLWMNWSSGKDAALALIYLQKTQSYQINALLTTVTKDFERVSMHAVREALLLKQANALGLSLHTVSIPAMCTGEHYEEQMQKAIDLALREGVDTFGFGDIFLEDVRRYREDKLKKSGITPVFPLWGISTDDLAKRVIQSGIKAIITCVDPRVLPPSFAGREYNEDFLKDLPEGVDPCGERGEFHSFVYDAPLFKEPIVCHKGERVEREGFVFVDLY